MATRSLNVQITGDTRSLNRALSGSEAKLGKFGKVAGIAGAAAGGALVLGLKKAVTSAADFEQQMSRLGAVSDATGKQMATLKQQALDAGAATKFSALEAAQAQTELAKGGLALKDILDGGLDAALGLAAAGEMDLAEAAETAVNAMKLFKIDGRDATHVADALATAANSTTADVSDFALALKQGGSAAKAAGYDIDETVTFLEALAEAGIKGSDAGTSMKTALVHLANPVQKTRDLMDSLGLKFFDAKGEMLGLSEMSAHLRDKLGGMTREQKLSTIATIGGTDGMRGLLAIMDAGPAKLDKMEKGLAKQGTAADVAAKKQDNLRGKWENFMGSIETLSIQVGTKLLPFLTDATESATRFINKTQQGRGPLAALARAMGTVARAVSDLVGWFRRHRTSTTVLMSVVAGLTAAWVSYRVAVLAAAAATKVMAVAQAALTVVMRANPIALVATAIIGLGTALVVAYKRSETFRRVVNTAFRAVRRGAEDASAALKTVAIPAFNQLRSVVDKAARGLRAVGGALGAIKDTAGKGADWLGIGDGLGILGGSSGGSGAGLMGADLDLGPFARIGASLGLRVSSGFRSGAITSSGNPSYHGTGDAIDMTGPPSAMSTFFQTMKGMFGSRLRELIYTPGGCVPLDTDILTREGWKRHDEVRIGDETIGYNPETGRSEWTRITGVVHYEDEALVEISVRNWHARVTPNHRWWTESRRQGAGFRETKDIVQESRLVLAAELAEDRSCSDEQKRDAAVLAWLLTDGTLTRHWPEGNVACSTIYQSKPERVEQLRALLADVPHRERARDRVGETGGRAGVVATLVAHEFAINSAWTGELLERLAVDRGLTNVVLGMSAGERKAFLRASLDAEGTVMGTSGTQSVSMNAGPVLDAIVLAAYLEGWRPSRLRLPSYNYEGRAVPFDTVNLCRPQVTGQKMKRRDLDRSTVWCVQTDLGTWTMRQDEQVMLTGNSGIKDGRPFTYTGQVAADHYDHVHVAYTGPFGDGIGRAAQSLKNRIGDGLGKFISTAYGPPWGGMQGSGVTATGVNLKSGPKRYGVAVDPSVVPLGTRARIWPNPFGWRGYFEAFDTGGAIKGKRLDFYDWRGRKAQNAWGRRTVTITSTDGDSSGGGSAGGGGPSRRVTPDMTPRQAFAESQSNAALQRAVALRAARKQRGGKWVMGPRGVPVLRGSGSGPQRGGGTDLSGGGGDIVEGGPVSDPAAEALTAAIEAQTRATEEHTQALLGVGSEMKRQTDLATSALATDKFQAMKYIADILSGQFGRGIVGRSFTPGAGVEVAY